MDFFGKVSGMTENDIVMIINSVCYELDTNPNLNTAYKKKLRELLIRLKELEKTLFAISSISTLLARSS